MSEFQSSLVEIAPFQFLRGLTGESVGVCSRAEAQGMGELRCANHRFGRNRRFGSQWGPALIALVSPAGRRWTAAPLAVRRGTATLSTCNTYCRLHFRLHALRTTISTKAVCLKPVPGGRILPDVTLRRRLHLGNRG